MVDTSVSFAGLDLPSPVFVGSGPNTKTSELALAALKAGAGAVEVSFGSIGDPDGNWIRFDEFQVLPSKQEAFRGKFYGFASTGARRRWPTDNYSIDFRIEQIRQIREENKGLGAVMVSIGGLGARDADWAELAHLAEEAGAQAVVLHLQTGQSLAGKTLMDDQEFLRRTVAVVKSACDVPVVAKLPIEGCDPVLLERLAAEAGADAVAPTARYIGLSIDIDRETVSDWQSFHGYGGPWALPITAAWTARTARAGLDLPMISGGGVSSWQDMVRLLLAGATMVQVCTWVIMRGYGVIRPALEHLRTWMSEKGYRSIADFRGRPLPDLREPTYMWSRRLEEGLHQGVWVDEAKCTGCGACVNACFFSAIYIAKGGKAQIMADRCAGCGSCYNVCPADAVMSPAAVF